MLWSGFFLYQQIFKTILTYRESGVSRYVVYAEQCLYDITVSEGKQSQCCRDFFRSSKVGYALPYVALAISRALSLLFQLVIQIYRVVDSQRPLFEGCPHFE